MAYELIDAARLQRAYGKVKHDPKRRAIVLDIMQRDCTTGFVSGADALTIMLIEHLGEQENEREDLGRRAEGSHCCLL